MSGMSKPPKHYKPSHMVFIGGIPPDMRVDEFQEEVNGWPGLVSWRYKGPPLGWGTATFRTPEARNNFLKDRPKHRLGSKIVDVKEYYWEERPEPGTVPAPAPVPKPAPVPVPIPREPFTPQWKSTSLDQALQNCQTGKIARYVDSCYGMIMTSHGLGMFNADVVYTCTTCGLNCKSSSCPDYKRFTDKEGRAGVALYKALPHGTQVNFIGRTIPPSAGAAGSGGAKFQATLVWPQLSKKPLKPELPTPAQLDIMLQNFIKAENGIVTVEKAPIAKPAPVSAPPTVPIVGSSRGASLAPGAGRPTAAPNLTMPPPFTHGGNLVAKGGNLSSNNLSMTSTDGDSGGLDMKDIDGILDRMKPISEFLNDQLGVYFAQEVRLKHAKMGLTNRLMNEKDEDKAIQQIFEALDRFKIQVDDSKRASIAANWRVLSHSFRARKTTPPAASSTPSGGSPASLSSSGGAPSPVNNATAAVTSNNEPYKEEGKIYYDEADMNRKFEEFLYNTCRGTDFGKLKNDNTVKVQCQMVSSMLKDMSYPMYMLAAEYERSVMSLNTEARPQFNRVLHKVFELGNFNSRILISEKRILDLIWKFLCEEKFYECKIETDPSRPYDEQINMANYIEMTSDTANSAGASSRLHQESIKAQLPPFGYICHALTLLKTKVFMVHVRFSILMKNVEKEASSQHSGGKMRSLKSVLKVWRKELREVLATQFGGDLKDLVVSDRGCDHLFAYLMYDKWVEDNKEVIKTKKGSIKDFEVYLSYLDLEGGSSSGLGGAGLGGTSDSQSEGSSGGSDSESDNDDDNEVKNALSNNSGGLRSNSSHLEVEAMKKLIGTEGYRSPSNDNSTTSSSNEVSLSTNRSSEDFLESSTAKKSSNSKIVDVKLKAIGSSFRSNPPKEESGTDLDKFVKSRPIYEHSYKNLISWLRDHHKTVQRDYNLAEGLVTYVKLVVNAWASLGPAGKTLLELKEEFRKEFTNPTALFARWAKAIESSTKSMDVSVSVDAIVKTTFNYCWETLQKTSKDTDASDVLRWYSGIPYSTSDGAYNTRGVVVHVFCSGDYGVIQTRLGKVLFERNICHVMGEKGEWQRCKSSAMAIKPGTMVKLHARLDKVKIKKTRVQYLYATKMWALTPEGHSEPASGILVQGKQSYWSEALGQFEKIVKQNMGQLRFTSEASHSEQAQKDYRQAFSKALKDKHNETLLAAKAAGDHTGNIIDVHGLRIESSLSNNFSNFQRFVDTQGEEMRIEANMTLDQMAFKDLADFNDWRKVCLVHKLTESMEGFLEYVEAKLLTMYEKPNIYPTNFVSESVTDIAPVMEKFFLQMDNDEGDKIIKGQMTEYKNMFEASKKEGIVAHLECVFFNLNSILSKLNTVKTNPNNFGDQLYSTADSVEDTAAAIDNDSSQQQQQKLIASALLTDSQQQQLDVVKSVLTSEGSSFGMPSLDELGAGGIGGGARPKNSAPPLTGTANPLPLLESFTPNNSFMESGKLLQSAGPPGFTSAISSTAANQLLSSQPSGMPSSVESELQFQMLSREVRELKEQVAELKECLRKNSEEAAIVQSTNNTIQNQQNKTIQDIALKLELLQASSSTNGVNGMPNGGEGGGAKVSFVKVVTPEGAEIEFPTDEAGNLSLKSVTDIHGPGVNALKYKTANNATRIVRLANQVFYAPEDGWGTRQYHVNIRPNGSGAGASAGLGAAAAAPGATVAATAANAGQQQQQQQHIQAMTAAALTAGLPPVTAPGMLPGFRGQPPFATNPAAAQANQAAQQAHALAQAQQQQLFLQQLMKSYPSHNGSV